MRWLLVVLVLALVGCVAVGRWLAPVTPEELPVEARKQLAARDKAVAAKDAEIAKIRTSKPTSLWPIYLVGAISLAGGAAVGYFLGKVILGVLLAVGGAGCIAWAQFLERFPWAMWIPFGAGVLAGAYFLWDWYRGLTAGRLAREQAVALEAIIPALEDAEPKKAGDAPSGPIKAAIALLAGTNVGRVRAVVDAAKVRVGLRKE